MNRIRKLFVILIFFTISVFCYGQSTGPSQGEKLFKENKPEDAVQVLENEILNGQISANTYNFLGLGYYQLGAFEKSVDAFQRGIEAQPSNVKILSFNQGNSYYALKKYDSAVGCYTKSFQNDGTFYDALLNRANALLMDNQYKASRNDYILFLEKCPKDPQHEAIEEIIRLLADEIERVEEEARLAAEAEKAKWEQVDIPDLGQKVVVDKGPDWEPVDDNLETPEKPDDKPDWEKVETDKLKRPPVENTIAEKVDDYVEPEKVTDEVPDVPVDKKVDSQVVVENTSTEEEEPESWEQVDSIVEKPKPVSEQKPSWEQVDNVNDDIPDNYIDNGEIVTDESINSNWENLDSSDLEEMNRLEKESVKEREEYLAEKKRKQEEYVAEQKRKQEQEELDKKLREQMDFASSEKYKEDLRQQMIAEEEARRQQVLDDVANSLRKTDSENMTSGAEDIIDYEFEGELD